MENVNTIELNGQLYGIEDTTARTTAEQNSKELVKVKETANSAQTTATTAQTSASTAQTTANEAKTIATTAQTTADEAKTNATTKQPYLGRQISVLCPPNYNGTLDAKDIENITKIILGETPSNIKARVLLQSAPSTNYEVFGTIEIWQENGQYKLDQSTITNKITLFLSQNAIDIANGFGTEKNIYFTPLGFSYE